MTGSAEATIEDKEPHGKFPRRFNLTPRCVVRDLDEVETWIEGRKQAPCPEQAARHLDLTSGCAEELVRSKEVQVTTTSGDQQLQVMYGLCRQATGLPG